MHREVGDYPLLQAALALLHAKIIHESDFWALGLLLPRHLPVLGRRLFVVD